MKQKIQGIYHSLMYQRNNAGYKPSNNPVYFYWRSTSSQLLLIKPIISYYVDNPDWESYEYFIIYNCITYECKEFDVLYENNNFRICRANKGFNLNLLAKDGMLISQWEVARIYGEVYQKLMETNIEKQQKFLRNMGLSNSTIDMIFKPKLIALDVKDPKPSIEAELNKIRSLQLVKKLPTKHLINALINIIDNCKYIKDKNSDISIYICNYLNKAHNNHMDYHIFADCIYKIMHYISLDIAFNNNNGINYHDFVSNEKSRFQEINSCDFFSSAISSSGSQAYYLAKQVIGKTPSMSGNIYYEYKEHSDDKEAISACLKPGSGDRQLYQDNLTDIIRKQTIKNNVSAFIEILSPLHDDFEISLEALNNIMQNNELKVSETQIIDNFIRSTKLNHVSYIVDITSAKRESYELTDMIIRKIQQQELSIFLFESLSKFSMIHCDQAQAGVLNLFSKKFNLSQIGEQLYDNLVDAKIAAFIKHNQNPCIESIKKRHRKNAEIFATTLSNNHDIYYDGSFISTTNTSILSDLLIGRDSYGHFSFTYCVILEKIIRISPNASDRLDTEIIAEISKATLENKSKPKTFFEHYAWLISRPKEIKKYIQTSEKLEDFITSAKHCFSPCPRWLIHMENQKENFEQLNLRIKASSIAKALFEIDKWRQNLGINPNTQDIIYDNALFLKQYTASCNFVKRYIEQNPKIQNRALANKFYQEYNL